MWVLVINQHNYSSKTNRVIVSSLSMHHMSKKPSKWSTAVLDAQWSKEKWFQNEMLKQFDTIKIVFVKYASHIQNI